VCPRTDSKRDLEKNQTKIQMNPIQTPAPQKVSIEEESNESVIIGEPESKYPSILKKSSILEATSLNETTNLPPSFNLRSNQKSTPKKHCQNCESNVCSSNLSQFQSQTARQNDIKVDVHNEDEIQNDTSFYSCHNASECV